MHCRPSIRGPSVRRPVPLSGVRPQRACTVCRIGGPIRGHAAVGISPKGDPLCRRHSGSARRHTRGRNTTTSATLWCHSGRCGDGWAAPGKDGWAAPGKVGRAGNKPPVPAVGTSSKVERHRLKSIDRVEGRRHCGRQSHQGCPCSTSERHPARAGRTLMRGTDPGPREPQMSRRFPAGKQ